MIGFILPFLVGLFLASHARTWVVRPAHAMDRAKLSDHTLVKMIFSIEEAPPSLSTAPAAPALQTPPLQRELSGAVENC